MEKKTYSILTGDTYEIEANSAKEALAKFWADWNSKECPCKSEDCECVGLGEAMTVVINADPEEDSQ